MANRKGAFLLVGDEFERLVFDVDLARDVDELIDDVEDGRGLLVAERRKNEQAFECGSHARHRTDIRCDRPAEVSE